MNKVFLFLLLSLSLAYGQKKDLIYRFTESVYPTVGYAYEVNVLILNEYNEYSLIRQSYRSKRMARKNIPFKFVKEKGTYFVNADTIKLKENDTENELFFIRKRNYLIYLYDKIDRTSHWKSVSN